MLYWCCPPLWCGVGVLSCLRCPGSQVSALSLRNEKPAVGASAAVLGGDVGQVLLQALAVNPGAADLLPCHLASITPKLVRVQLGHAGLDLILNAADLGFSFFNQPLQAPNQL